MICHYKKRSPNPKIHLTISDTKPSTSSQSNAENIDAHLYQQTVKTILSTAHARRGSVSPRTLNCNIYLEMKDSVARLNWVYHGEISRFNWVCEQREWCSISSEWNLGTAITLSAERSTINRSQSHMRITHTFICVVLFVCFETEHTLHKIDMQTSKLMTVNESKYLTTECYD